MGLAARMSRTQWLRVAKQILECAPQPPSRALARSLALIISVLLVVLLALQITASAARQPGQDHRKLDGSARLVSHQLRVRRQVAGGGGGQQPAANAAANQATTTQTGAAGTTGLPADSSGQPDASGGSEDKPPEEVLSSLKCDFGSADAPDLCKFKILESENPLAKGLATWTLGSGRLALYQGGPVIDASQGNDSFGGYIFYETSNPYALAPSPGQPGSGEQHASFMLSNGRATAAAANVTASHHHAPSDYSTVLSSAFASQRHSGRAGNRAHEMHGSDNDHAQPSSSSSSSSSSFQQVSSARVSVAANSLGPAFLSPNLTAPGPSGMCLSFYYAIQGLSAEELKVSVNDHKTGRSRQIWAASESAASNWTRAEVLYSATNQHSLTFAAASGLGSAGAGKDLQQRKFRGHLALDEIEVNKHEPLGESGPCKGHCNFDGDLCGWTNAENGVEDNFDWSFGRGSDNLFTGPARDFTSSSNNELTGSYLFTDSSYPRRPGDRALLISPMFQPTAVNEAMCMRLAVHMFGSGVGSLAIKIRYADEGGGGGGGGGGGSGAGGGAGSTSGGQEAAGQASSAAGAQQQQQQQQQQPGALPGASQLARASSGDAARPNGDLVIWEMSGDAGNSWHQAQTSVSSARSSFQVLIEGVIGENHLGNIAVDEISFSSGPCPTSPPVASKNYGDCTFEQSMCYWRNPDADIHLDDLDWVRTADEQSIHGPNFDHTLKRRSGSYLRLENTFREPKSGSRAFLLSPVFQPKTSGSVQCLSFYYYMFMRSISSSGPNLGTIRVYLASNNELVPIWRLTNPISAPHWKHARASLSTATIDGEPQAPTKLFQIAFEGIWGDAASGAIALDDVTVFDGACSIMPAEAKSVPGECTFDADMCSWANRTYAPTGGQLLDPADTSRSPFLQSVNSAAAAAATGANFHQPAQRLAMLTSGGGGSGRRPMSWQLATVDSRPVNLQDHTYKAPIGYAYVDVLDGGGGGGGANQPAAFQLQASEVANPAGQQVTLCLTFWFAAYGRNDANQLQVYLTQASAPPQPPEEGSGGASGGAPGPAAGGAAGSRASTAQAGGGGGGAASAATGSSGLAAATSADESENANAWKEINGKLLWSASLKNITEVNRRKWLYGQVGLKADSNYIVRFVAVSSDGGFALDDLSFFDGLCETRPAHARIQSAEDEAADIQAAQQPPAQPAGGPPKPPTRR